MTENKDIQMKQIIAGEEAVIARLRQKGLIPKDTTIKDVITIQLIKEELDFIKYAVRYTESRSTIEDDLKVALLNELNKNNTDKGEWVSVETPPEKKGYYLCYDTNFGSDQPMDVLFYQPYNDSWFYKADTFHPQFWMPLPSPPNK